MVLSQDIKNNLLRKHNDLCNTLNLDIQTINTSWENFERIHNNFTLEGDPLNWIGCSIYVACRVTSTPTVEQSMIEGNGVNLTSLLRHCNLSFAQFFSNIRKWSDMAELSNDFNNKIEHLQRTFTVTYNIFKEYHKIYVKIFKTPEPLDLEQPKHHRNRKQKPIPCSTSKVFEFCWILFTTIKQKDPSYSEDYVSLFHLLITIFDYAFKNAFLDDRRDLLNPTFQGLPSDWSDSDYQPPKDAPCIIDSLCTDSSMITEAKYIKHYQCSEFIKDLFSKGALTSNGTDLTGIFDSTVFDKNFKNILNMYETLLLSHGGFDERIFLAEYRRKLLEEKSLSSTANEGSDGLLGESPRNSQSGMVTSQNSTPLSDRKLLGSKEQNEITPMGVMTDNISKLNSILNGCQPAPSEALEELFQSVTTNPKEIINNIITELSQKFTDAYVNGTQTDQTEYVNRRVQLGKTLFYKLIERILENEKQIHKDISAIIEKEIFYQCVFACSMEIVIYAYNSQRKFPWILNVLNIESYNFIKVIEPIVRSKVQLSRGIIKYLNMIEEMIMSSLIWKSDSLLWRSIELSADEIPKFEETALPNQLNNENENSSSCLRKILNSELTKQAQSPNPSATDRFQSPIAQNTSVNRQLFPTSQPGQSLLQKHTHIFIRDRNGNSRIIPIVDGDAQRQFQVQEKSPKTPPKPRKTGSLPILFRKFFNLSGERLEHLCSSLSIHDSDIKRKIWTVFEESIRNTKLMKDRDLDQLLMCAVYVICKVSSNHHRNFIDIMKSYRVQPQATSDIYRNVLLQNKRTEVIDDQEINHQEERGDLINFYNTIYVEEMKTFAVRFAIENCAQKEEILLSPLPAVRRQIVSPSVQVFKNNVFVKPLDSPTIPITNGKSYNYYFSRSPSKDLKDINKAIKSNGISGKRLLVEGDMDLPMSKRIANRKVQSLIEERRNQNSE